VDGFIDSVIQFISDEAFSKLIITIAPIFATYYITKYNIYRPKRIAIKEKQFTNAYLPLYRLIFACNQKDITKEKIDEYALQMKEILSDNYEFVFPQLHDFNSKLLKCEDDETKFKIFEKIKYQVEQEYNKLKKKLGYPSISLLSIFIRMSGTDKTLMILYACLLTWGIFGLYFIFLFPLAINQFRLDLNLILQQLAIYIPGLLILFVPYSILNRRREKGI
jgi:hypothetical protein